MAAQPVFTGSNSIELLTGGDQWFPALHRAIDGAQRDIWLTSYIFHDDACAGTVAHALKRAAARGVRVAVVVDGFGSSRQLRTVTSWFAGSQVELAVFRPLNRWYAWIQPGQMRRLHHKLVSVDGEIGFVGGINIIDDRLDVKHGVTDTPRLDFAVELRGPVVAAIERTIRTVWTRAALGADWRAEALALARGSQPFVQFNAMRERLRRSSDRDDPATMQPLEPTRVALVTRDNLRQRSAIEHSYLDALASACVRIDLISPYFYPGRYFRLALIQAARRGVAVRVILQGKVDYPLAALAARVQYDEMLTHGIQIFEYTHAYLHAKVAMVDGRWSTVGSSNIDPMSLVLNLEANVVVQDDDFARVLGAAFERAIAQSVRVESPRRMAGWRSVLRRSFVASVARWFLSLAGVSGRY